MTAQLARAFFDLLWLAVTWNWGQNSNSDPRTKKEASMKSISWWQCMAVAWNGIASYPGPSGGERAWYTLQAHAPGDPRKNGGNRILSYTLRLSSIELHVMKNP